MMKLLIVCVGVGAAAATSYDKPIPILRDVRTQNAAGKDSFEYETSNGIVRSESARQYDGKESSGAVSPEGVPVAISFTSGVDGYQPQGDVLPMPVELPDQRSDTFVH